MALKHRFSKKPRFQRRFRIPVQC